MIQVQHEAPALPSSLAEFMDGLIARARESEGAELADDDTDDAVTCLTCGVCLSPLAQQDCGTCLGVAA